MRAIAVLAVVGVHAAVIGHGVSASFAGRLVARLNIGVTIFFVISGFLLYRPMIAHRAGGAPAPATGDYAKRRFLRIYPAYWLALTLLAIIPGAPAVILGPWWPMYAMVHTLPIYHGTPCVNAIAPCALSQTWSLVVELTFYIALPFYALGLGRLTRRFSLRAWVITQLVVLALLSALSVVLQFVVLDPVPAWFGAGVTAYVLWFALGMGLAVISVTLHGRPAPPRPIALTGAHPGTVWALALAGFVAIAYWLPATTFVIDRTQVMVAHVGYALIAALLLVPAVIEPERGGLPRRVLAHPVLAWLGVISYGIFLWHVAIEMKLSSSATVTSFGPLLALALGISIPVAAGSYYLLERPLLRLKYRRLGNLRRVRPRRASA